MINLFNKKNQLPDISFKEYQQHMSWCIDNDIVINFVNQSWNVGFIRINEKGKIYEYCNEFGIAEKYKQIKLRPNDKVWAKKVYELYSELYIKYNPEFKPLKIIKKNERRKQGKNY